MQMDSLSFVFPDAVYRFVCLRTTEQIRVVYVNRGLTPKYFLLETIKYTLFRRRSMHNPTRLRFYAKSGVV